MLHFVLLGILIVGLGIVWAWRQEKKGDEFLSLVIFVSALLLWITTPLYFEFSGWPQSVPVTFDGSHVVKHSWGVFTLGRNFSNLPLQDIATAATVTPLTENPKMRKVESKIAVRVGNPQAFYSMPGITRRYRWQITDNSVRGGVVKEITLTVDRALYTFHEEHSRELGQLFNPLLEGQQEQFLELVSKSLVPVLAEDGLKVVSAEFSLP